MGERSSASVRLGMAGTPRRAVLLSVAAWGLGLLGRAGRGQMAAARSRKSRKKRCLHNCTGHTHRFCHRKCRGHKPKR
jgi:hypothetical protein